MSAAAAEAAAGRVLRVPQRFPAPRAWWLCFAVALSLLALFFVSVGVLFGYGPGVWGNNIPVSWGFPIANTCGGSASATRAR